MLGEMYCSLNSKDSSNKDMPQMRHGNYRPEGAENKITGEKFMSASYFSAITRPWQ